tara:strand:+ start:244 stop:513 length:270 start_codon:yes stop_codon:yes gene_type:complete
METATKRIQEVLKEKDYMQVNLHRAIQKGLAQTLQSELNIAIKTVNELNEKRQQAQFDYECLDAKLKSLKAKHDRIKEIDAKFDINKTI